jgi:hypothetical protein
MRPKSIWLCVSLFLAMVTIPTVAAEARNYHPSMGRWIERDPAGYSNGANLSSYGMHSPTNTIDPSGLQIKVCTDTGMDSYLEGYSVSGYQKVRVADGVIYSGNAHTQETDIKAQIVAAMIASNRTLSGSKTFNPIDFKLDNLILHIKARAAIVDFAIQKSYDFTQSTTATNGQVSYKNTANGAYWNVVPNQDHSDMPYRLVLIGSSATAALNDLNVHPALYHLDCTSAAILTLAAGTANAMGGASYDRLVKDPLDDGQTITDTTNDEEDWIPGDRGIVNRNPRNPANKWGNEINMVYVGVREGRRLYSGHTGVILDLRTLPEWKDAVAGKAGSTVDNRRIRSKTGLKN